MWKYVSRRVKDTLEKTYNVFDVSRSGFCSEAITNGASSNTNNSSSNNQQNKDPCSDLALFKRQKCRGYLLWQKIKERRELRHEAESGNEEKRQNRRRLNHENILPNWIGAITWSSAIVCGWYTSQLICMKRKHLGWTDNRCRYSNALLSTTRQLHTNINTHIVHASPPYRGPFELINHPNVEQFVVFNVNNEKEEQKGQQKRHDSGINEDDFGDQSQSKRTIQSAVNELCSTLGEIEFQFGVENLIAGEYKTAVSHLKLATTHHHAGATFNLGLCYEKGLGVDKNLKTAMECYQVASALGHPKAMYNLGIFYIRGLGGLKRNRKAARQCFVAASQLNLAEAKAALELKKKQEMTASNYEQTELQPQALSWRVTAF